MSFIGYFYIANAYKVFVYAVKLRIEFVILNRLLDSFKARTQDLTYTDITAGDADKRSRSFSIGTDMRLGKLNRHSLHNHTRIMSDPEIGDRSSDEHKGNIMKTTKIETRTHKDTE